MASGCGQSENARPSAEERDASVVSASTQSQGMPLVVVPTDSPRFKQLRIEPVREQTFPTDEVVAPAKVIINPNRFARVLPHGQGLGRFVMVKYGDAVCHRV